MNLKLKYILIIFLIIGIQVRIPAQETILPAAAGTDIEAQS